MNRIERARAPYRPLTASMVLGLAAPHTWVAAIVPAAVGLCLAAAQGPVSVTLSLAMLVIVVLMQSAVNTFNDYYDYVKGTDDEDAALEESDAVLVYNAVNPKSALWLAVAMLACAFALGIYPIAVAGPAPLIIALVGALFVVLYSAGRTPLSYLPLGEAVSGIVMGGLIPLAYVQVLTGRLEPLVLVWSIPAILGVGLIMATNNVSDIERDAQAGRSTMAVVLGRKRAVACYGAGLVAWVASFALCCAAGFPAGLMILPFAVFTAIPALKTLWSGRLEPPVRPRSMNAITTLNGLLGAFYCAAILAGSGIALTL